MNLVDSSGWLAYFSNTKNALKFARPLQDLKHLIVPTIVMYEVFKVMLREKDENAAILAQAHMQEGVVVQLSAELAVLAAQKSIEFRIPMADAIIFATAQSYNALLWTQDEHFSGLKNVNYYAL
jgi:predicted nucleic acid-binding protein